MEGAVLEIVRISAEITKFHAINPVTVKRLKDGSFVQVIDGHAVASFPKDNIMIVRVGSIDHLL